MTQTKDRILRRIQEKAAEEAEDLVRELARAVSEEKEAILAGLEFEQWLADTCRECQEP